MQPNITMAGWLGSGCKRISGFQRSCGVWSGGCLFYKQWVGAPGVNQSSVVLYICSQMSTATLLHQLDVFQLNIAFCYLKEPKISLDHGPFSWCLIKFVFFNNVLTWVSLSCRARRGCPYCIPTSNSQGMRLFASFMSIGLTIVSDENINNIWLFPWKRCMKFFFIIIVNSPLSYLWCSGWSKKRLSSKISLGVYSQLREVCQGTLQ